MSLFPEKENKTNRTVIFARDMKMYSQKKQFIDMERKICSQMYSSEIIFIVVESTQRNHTERFSARRFEQ